MKQQEQDTAGRILIKLQETGSRAIALKKFLAESNRDFSVYDQPEGIYEFHILCKDLRDVFDVGHAHGKIHMSTV